jgi:hypothetical protein
MKDLVNRLLAGELAEHERKAVIHMHGVFTPYPFQARKFAPVTIPSEQIPSIAGLWNVQVKSSKGESAWQLIVRQAGAAASAAILRIDGDTGLLTGTFHDGKFVLSHFSGARPLRLELTPAPTAALVVQAKDAALVATRSELAKAKGCRSRAIRRASPA